MNREENVIKLRKKIISSAEAHLVKYKRTLANPLTSMHEFKRLCLCVTAIDTLMNYCDSESFLQKSRGEYLCSDEFIEFMLDSKFDAIQSYIDLCKNENGIIGIPDDSFFEGCLAEPAAVTTYYKEKEQNDV